MHANRIEIENAITNYNRDYFQKANETKLCKSKINEILKNNNMNNKILEGRLQRSECDNNDIFEFLKLLKQLEELRNRSQL